MTAPERRAADEPSHYALVDGLDGQWLVEIVNHPSCTCGGGYEGHHEPGCGQDPIGTVDSILDGLADLAAERQLREQAERSLATANAMAASMRQRRDSALAELARLREAVEDFAEHGVRADLQPTMDCGSVGRLYVALTRYLHRIDEDVRERARAALAGAGQGETKESE